MVKKGLWLIAAALIVGLFASAAMALDPIGKPAAGLAKGQWSAAFEFAMVEETVEVSGPWISSEDVLEDVEFNKYYGRFAYGPTDDWEVFGRLGMTDLKFDGDADFASYPLPPSNTGVEFNPSGEFAYGLGVKHTFIDDGKTKWGGVFQYSSSSFDGKVKPDAYPTYEVCLKGDWYEMQFAFGPSWMASDNVCIYGGPFLHYLEGDLELDEDMMEGENNFEAEQESEIGAFLGLQADLGGGVFAGVEGQITQDAWLITGNVGVLLGP